MITIHPFTKSYHQKTVLDFPGMTLEPSSIYAVIGSNGSGKSTLAKVLSGVEKADSPGKPPLSCHTDTGYLPQKPYAFHMTLRRNILLNKDKNDTCAMEKADKLIKAFELADLADKNGARLSGGETARMALARLMIKDYSLLILDEPTAAIDMNNTLHAEQAIREYTKRTRASVLLITHSLNQALRLSDTVLYLENGILIEQGSTAEILKKPATSKLQNFLDFYSLK